MLKLFNKKKKDNKGFTLVELVIVVAILAILVGVLAPQYTKYVEKSRKAADAANMDEMVKVVKVYAADPANELETGTYTITIGTTGGTKLVATPKSGTGGETWTIDSESFSGVAKELKDSIPSCFGTTTKSQKWGDNGDAADIIATVTVNPDGGTKVEYTTGGTNNSSNKFGKYMSNGAE